MKTVIGIDVGMSTTKIIGIKFDSILEGMLVKATDPITSLFGALGKYIHDNNLSFLDIEKIMITGVGSAYILKQLYGVSTGKVDEFVANGVGGAYVSKLTNAVVVSMGTGTSFVKVEGDNISHIAGTGIGGGTIIGLSKLLLDTSDIDTIIEFAKNGNLSNVDLQIKDITKIPLPGLPMEATASNFGKIMNGVKKEDIAAGIINMVLQAIGEFSVFSVMNTNIKDLIMIGNIAKIPQCKDVFNGLGNMFSVNFIIPDSPEYVTAIGAARAYIEGKNYLDIKER